MKEPLSIGIIGGMSPESTVTYYQHIVRRHQVEFQDHSYPRIVISSVSFQKYIEWQHAEEWGQIARTLEFEFQSIAAAGADFALLATNTMHKVLPSIESPIPVLSVLDEVAGHAAQNGIKCLGLTGTKFTMSDGFYAAGLEKHGLCVLTPLPDEQEAIHRIIYNELISGKVTPSSLRRFDEIAQSLLERGADAVLLGCTELQMLMRDDSSGIRLIDSTKIHADAAWEVALRRSQLRVVS